jgi:O-antigen ligase
MPANALHAEQQGKPTSESSHPILMVGLLALLMGSVLVFGATEAWSQFLQRAAALALLTLWLVHEWRRRELELNANAVYIPCFLFGMLVVAQFVFGVTEYRYATLSEIPNLIVYGILILLTGELLNRRHNLRVFLNAMAVFGSALAVLAVLVALSGTSKIYGLRATTSISAAVFGPFANHNHYAGLMEMLVPIGAAAAILQEGAKRALLLFGTVIMALSIVFSRSRGGMVALACGVVFACVVLVRMQRQRRGALAILAACAVVMIFVLFLGTDKIFERLSETQDQFRFSIYADSLRMAMHKPLLGYGLGAFPHVYPEFQSFWTNLLVNHAHNDYLELLVETGVLGLALFGWVIVVVFRRGFGKLQAPENDEGRLMTFALLTGVTSLVVHSLIDFNLHIPANAALFFVLCSALATPFKHRVRPVDPEPWVTVPGDDLVG